MIVFPMKHHYIIVAEALGGESGTHVGLAQKVNERMDEGYQPLGRPFLGNDMMYQAMLKDTRPVQQVGEVLMAVPRVVG